MRIDTSYRAMESVVTIELQSEEERRLCDNDLKRIACNQHFLRWGDDKDGGAYLPEGNDLGAAPGFPVAIERDGDHILITYTVTF